MKVTIDTESKTICPVYPATLEELAKLEGILKAHYGAEEWKYIGEASDNNAPFTLPDSGHQCVPMPLYPVERGQPMPLPPYQWAGEPIPCAPNTGTPLIAPPFVIAYGRGVEAMATFPGLDFTTTSARDWEAFNTKTV